MPRWSMKTKTELIFILECIKDYKELLTSLHFMGFDNPTKTERLLKALKNLEKLNTMEVKKKK